MNILVGTGAAWVQGRCYYNETNSKILPISNADTTNSRIDRVVLRLDLTFESRDITAVIKTGTPSASPTPPELQRDNIIWELSICQYIVTANATVPTNLIDERQDLTLCGYYPYYYNKDETYNKSEIYNKDEVYNKNEINETFTSVADGFLPGDIRYFARATPRPGYLEANGALLSRTDYPALWAEAQDSGNLVTEAVWSANNYGSYSTGDGNTTFRIPDLRGRVILGAGQGSGLTNRGLGTVGGKETCSLTADQNGPHAHEMVWANGSSTGGLWGGPVSEKDTTLNVLGYTTLSSGLGSPHPNMQPWVAELVCIKY
jgi:microcystin-dependent protein